MIPGDFPLSLYRGDTGRWQFKLWSDAAKTKAVDLTGVTVAAQIRDKSGGENVTDLNCSVTIPNTINVALSSTQSATLPAKGAWDLQLTYPSGDVITILAGKVAVTSDITADTVTRGLRAVK